MGRQTGWPASRAFDKGGWRAGGPPSVRSSGPPRASCSFPESMRAISRYGAFAPGEPMADKLSGSPPVSLRAWAPARLRTRNMQKCFEPD